MDQSYVLNPTHFEFIVEDHFPKLSNNKKVGVFLSGGMESSLISLIAKRYYGEDRVIFFYSDNIFSSNDPERNVFIHTNINRAAKLLDITPTYLDFNYAAHVGNRKQSIQDKMQSLKVDYAVDFVMFGFTKLFFEVEVFKQPGMTIEKIMSIAYADPDRYKSTIEEFHLATGKYIEDLLSIDIPAEVYPLLRETSGFIKSPFKQMNKCEVVDLYRQLDLLDVLYETSSCIRNSLTITGKHCGVCFNCQQRWDAFKILGNIEDLTEYNSTSIKDNREELENVIHSQNS
jgi:7-cyano-7-deazaguanine synthase in queuosine biosynthesis